LRVAFAVWNDRIAPVFDVTRRVYVADLDGRRVVGAWLEPLDGETAAGRASRLAALGIDALVCGAISRPQQALLEACGIVVVPLVTGGLAAVVEAWGEGTLGGDAFAMPGCGQRRRFRGGRNRSVRASARGRAARARARY
jgi:predicted Fe-Mo cluster-binding NifX family protein